MAERSRRLTLCHPVFSSFEWSFFRVCDVEQKTVLVEVDPSCWLSRTLILVANSARFLR
jgi:hypothetical protein